MTKDYHAIANDVSAGAAASREAIPDQMKGFGGLGAAAYQDDALSPKFKELIALAIGITVRCDGCVAYHAKVAFEKGATREEVAEADRLCAPMTSLPRLTAARF